MEWTKKGVVLEAPPPLPWSASHAALPVARSIGDRTEIYFSTRDAEGRSHVARATVASDLVGPPDFDPVPVLEPGTLGTFDDAGVTTGCLVETSGALHLFYSGWTRGVTVPFYFFVGCAESVDGGQTFGRVSPSPVLERNPVDPYLTASPWVLVEDGLWRMWYVSGTGWDHRPEGPRHHYHIKYAESRDGFEWTRTGHVCIDYRDEDEYAHGRPCVVNDGGLYRMWFSARGDAYRLAYAESEDGLHWERRDEEAGVEPSSDGWDSEMICYPAIYDHRGTRYLLYNGNGYGSTGTGYAVFRS